MYDEETRSVIIDMPKLKHFAEESAKHKGVKHVKKRYKDIKHVMERRFKPSKAEVKKFSLPVIKPISVATFKNEGFLLPYTSYLKGQENYKLRQLMRVGLREHYKTIEVDLQQRLHVDDLTNYCRAVTDFDQDFFTCVNALSLSSYVAPFKSLKHLFNRQLRLRQEVGYRNDCMLNIDTNYKREQQVYNASLKRYLEQVKYLDSFILDDYRKSMLSLGKWDEVKQALSREKNKLQCLAAKAFTITSRIVVLDYRFNLQRKYGRFLYYISPPGWRFKNRNFARSIEIEAKGFDFGTSSEEDTFNVMLEKLKRECYSGVIKPVLYFHHPHDLAKLFDVTEQQLLHHFIHVVQLAHHVMFFKKGINFYKEIIAQDSAGTLNTIKYFEKRLQYGEDQRSQFEAKFFKIINGLFYESVGAPEVLKFQTHLEFCYEKIYNEKPINMDIVATAKALEGAYMDYSKRLEAVTGREIKTAMAQYIDSERRKCRRAKVAARELRLFERLERNLLRICAPVTKNQKVDTFTIQRNSRRKLFSKTKNDENRSSLTEAEVEYLTLFTDWTDKEDPSQYLHNLSTEETEQLN